MSEYLTSILQNPFKKQNLELLAEVNFTNSQTEMSNFDDHIVRGYCMIFDKTYAEIKDEISLINKDNFAVNFCLKNLHQNSEINEIISSPLFKESEQLRLCSMLHRDSFKTVQRFTKYICKNTNFSERLKHQQEKFETKNFHAIAKIQKTNVYGNYLEQEIKLNDSIKKMERKNHEQKI